MHWSLKQFIPSFFNAVRYYSFKYGWKGDYPSYEAAKKISKGYDEDYILNKIANTTRKVKNGDVIYERDGIIYDEIQNNINLLCALLLVASKNNNKLTLIDFGGSLGTSYYQNIHFLSHLTELNWCIIEQEHYVRIGKQEFENKNIKFFNTIEECVDVYGLPNMILLSSSLQYFEKPYEALSHIQSFNIPFLALDLIAYNDTNRDRIAIQNVPPTFYGTKASYPCIFFSRDKLSKQLSDNYKKLFDFAPNHEKYYINLKPFRYEGALWQSTK